jgi:hypothetical protein
MSNVTACRGQFQAKALANEDRQTDALQKKLLALAALIKAE